MHERTVVITGVGAVGPGFLNYPGLKRVLEEGVISCAPLTRFCTKEFKTKLAFQIDQGAFSDPTIDPVRRPLIVQYGDRVLAEALAMAGIKPGEVDPVCVFGTTIAGAWEMEAAYGSLEKYAPGYTTAWSALDAASMEYPGRLILEPLRPKKLSVVTTGCTSGLDALGAGWLEILDGADCAVVVSSEAPLSPLGVTSFDQINALTKETARPDWASLPFCAQRSGFCIGEGAAALVLEEASFARRRGAPVLGTLRGYATTSSAYHMCAIHPDGDAVYRSMAEAVQVAGIEPAEIGLIAAHATATRQNDIAEHTAFSRLVGDLLPTIPVFAGKANFGHALGSSNLIELAAVVWIMNSGRVPLYPRRRERELEFDDLLLPEQSMPLKGRLVVKNSSGFSGIHSAIVLEGPHVSH